MKNKRIGFIKFMKSGNSLEIMKKNKAFTLLALIAQRARWTDSLNVDDLKIGEALIGDYQSIGLSEQEYRTAKKHLKKFGLAMFRSTNKGTIATLTDKTIFDTNSEYGANVSYKHETSNQRTSNDQVTTNKNKKNENNNKLCEFCRKLYSKGHEGWCQVNSMKNTKEENKSNSPKSIRVEFGKASKIKTMPELSYQEKLKARAESGEKRAKSITDKGY